MSRPRTFVSSTFYDLADARATIKTFLESIGHEPLMHETPSFGVTPGKHSHVACLDQVDLADYLILIVGGRRGGTFLESEKSITNEEYRRAIRRKIPIILFVKKEVETAWAIYKNNPKGDFSTIVNDNRIFDFIDVIKSQAEDNWTFQFETVIDIINFLRGQFAYIHLLFSQKHISERTKPIATSKIAERILVPFPSDFSLLTDNLDPSEASYLVRGLKSIHTVLTMMIERKVQGYEEKAKVLWLMGRYGRLTGADWLSMPEPSFKQYSWGVSKGRTIFRQLADFGVNVSYSQDEDEDGPITNVTLSLDRNNTATYALQRYINDLLERYGEDDGLQFFYNADMRLYSTDGSVSAKDKAPSAKKSKGLPALGK